MTKSGGIFPISQVKLLNCTYFLVHMIQYISVFFFLFNISLWMWYMYDVQTCGCCRRLWSTICMIRVNLGSGLTRPSSFLGRGHVNIPLYPFCWLKSALSCHLGFADDCFYVIVYIAVKWIIRRNNIRDLLD